jgi:Tfp pilus assembly protein PilW
MIAVALGLIVIAGVINLFVANRKAYEVQSGNNFLQEDLRIAADRLGWALRMADFWGGNPASNVAIGTAGNGVTGNGSCNGTWATAVTAATTGGGGLYGYDGAASFPLDTTCIGGSANYLSGSDVFVVRFADPQVLAPGPAVTGVSPAESSTISNNVNELFVLSVPNASAKLFTGSKVPTINGTLPSYAYAYQLNMFYLRPCSVPVNNGTTCSAAADGGMPLPTLMRMYLNSQGALVSEPVIDGIEQMKVEYGVSTDLSTNVSPTYKTASQVTANAQWPNVVSVRVSLVAVNPTRDISIPHVFTATLGTVANACTYTINNGAQPTISNCPGFTPYGDKPWQFVRAQQQLVIELRNRFEG